jgi:hypothetical protein
MNAEYRIQFVTMEARRSGLSSVLLREEVEGGGGVCYSGFDDRSAPTLEALLRRVRVGHAGGALSRMDLSALRGFHAAPVGPVPVDRRRSQTAATGRVRGRETRRFRGGCCGVD